MPAKIGLVAKSYLEGVALPQHGSTYTVISHKFVIDTVKEELNNHGFFIEEESYRSTHDGAIATGIYKLTHKEDPELSMAFGWTNSYNKMVKFKAVIGAISNVNESFMILGDQGSWSRKHTGTADIEAKEQIINQIKNASIYYTQLLDDKNKMKEIELSKRKQAELLGILYADYSILESTTANIVKGQMIKPGFFYNGGADTLWAFYNHLIFSIQNNHPKTWLEEQRMCHYIITNEFNLLAPITVSKPLVIDTKEEEDQAETEKDPMQIDLEDSIAEIENSKEEFINQNINDEDLELMAQQAAEDEEYIKKVEEKTELENHLLDETTEDEVSQELSDVNSKDVETNFSLDIDEEEEEKHDENPEEEEEVSTTEEVIENDLSLASVGKNDEDDDEELDFL